MWLALAVIIFPVIFWGSVVIVCNICVGAEWYRGLVRMRRVVSGEGHKKGTTESSGIGQRASPAVLNGSNRVVLYNMKRVEMQGIIMGVK